jgi:hypothetical protein
LPGGVRVQPVRVPVGIAQIEKEATDAKTEFLIGIVGPITSFLIGVICMGLTLALGWRPPEFPARPLPAMLMWLGYINITLAIFNMVPGFPLDGGRVLRAIIWWIMSDAKRATVIAARIGQVIAFGFIVLGVLRFFGGAGFGGGETPDAALVRAALAKLFKGDTLAFIYCDLAMDVAQAIKLVNDYKLKAVLVLGPDCYKAAKQIAASKLPVVLEPNLVFWETDPRTGEEKQIALPKVYREAGVPVTFQVSGFAAGNLFRAPNLPPVLGTNYLWYQAATAVKYGTPPDEALTAVTQRAADAIGVGKLVGSLEPGKDADLVILTGEPLKLDTWVDTTVIGGKVVYERDQDRKLKQLLKPAAK